MNRTKMAWFGVAVVALGTGYFLGQSTPKAIGQDAKAFGRYTVVETEITNAIIVDNQTNTCYYYTVERDAEPGSDLILRGSVDLNEVGKPVLKPKKAAK